jgi:hypothetical protein
MLTNLRIIKLVPCSVGLKMMTNILEQNLIMYGLSETMKVVLVFSLWEFIARIF